MCTVSLSLLFVLRLGCCALLLQSVFWFYFFFFSSRRRHTRFDCDWSSDVCSSDLGSVRQPPHCKRRSAKNEGGSARGRRAPWPGRCAPQGAGRVSRVRAVRLLWCARCSVEDALQHRLGLVVLVGLGLGQDPGLVQPLRLRLDHIAHHELAALVIDGLHQRAFRAEQAKARTGANGLAVDLHLGELGHDQLAELGLRREIARLVGRQALRGHALAGAGQAGEQGAGTQAADGREMGLAAVHRVHPGAEPAILRTCRRAGAALGHWFRCGPAHTAPPWAGGTGDRKSTRLNSSHSQISYAVFCLKKKKNRLDTRPRICCVSKSSPTITTPPST